MQLGEMLPKCDTVIIIGYLNSTTDFLILMIVTKTVKDFRKINHLIFLAFHLIAMQMIQTVNNLLLEY